MLVSGQFVSLHSIIDWIDSHTSAYTYSVELKTTASDTIIEYKLRREITGRLPKSLTFYNDMLIEVQHHPCAM